MTRNMELGARLYPTMTGELDRMARDEDERSLLNLVFAQACAKFDGTGTLKGYVLSRLRYALLEARRNAAIERSRWRHIRNWGGVVDERKKSFYERYKDVSEDGRRLIEMALSKRPRKGRKGAICDQMREEWGEERLEKALLEVLEAAA